MNTSDRSAGIDRALPGGFIFRGDGPNVRHGEKAHFHLVFHHNNHFNRQTTRKFAIDRPLATQQLCTAAHDQERAPICTGTGFHSPAISCPLAPSAPPASGPAIRHRHADSPSL